MVGLRIVIENGRGIRWRNMEKRIMKIIEEEEEISEVKWYMKKERLIFLGIMNKIEMERVMGLF